MGLFADLSEPKSDIIKTEEKSKKGIFSDLVDADTSVAVAEPEPSFKFPETVPLADPSEPDLGLALTTPSGDAPRESVPSKSYEIIAPKVERLAKQFWNKFIGPLARSTGTPEDVLGNKAYIIQEKRIEERQARNESLPHELLNDEFEDIKRQLAEPPGQRDDFDLQEIEYQYEPAKEKREIEFAVKESDKYIDKAIDVTAGIGGFIARLAILRKMAPTAPSEVIWEAENLATGGRPGMGAGTRAVLGGIGKTPTGTFKGKAVKTITEMGFFGGVTAVQGGTTEDIIVASLIPAVFNTYNFAKQRSVLKSYEKNLHQAAKDAHQLRMKRGMSRPVSDAHLQADMRHIVKAVAKAKQTIYQDDAFAPTRDKWAEAKKQALEMIKKGGKSAERGNAVLDFLAKPVGKGEIQKEIRQIQQAGKIVKKEKFVPTETKIAPKVRKIEAKPIKKPSEAPIKPPIPAVEPTKPAEGVKVPPKPVTGQIRGKQPFELTKKEFAESEQVFTPSVETLEKQPELAGKIDKPAVKIGDKVYTSDKADANHSDVYLDNKLDMKNTKAMPGYVDKQGNFLYQIPDLAHRIEIRNAVQAGKEVPREVLQEYREKWADEALAKLKAKPIQPSIGAAVDPKLDAALKRASQVTQTTYVVQRAGKWINTKTKPQFGDYYQVSAEKAELVKGQLQFKTDAEAIKAAQSIAQSTNKPIYISIGDTYNLVTEKPKGNYVKINPAGPGLTKAEKELLASPQLIAEAKMIQEEGAKVGFKAGRAEALQESRKKLDQFRLAQQLTDIHRKDALDIVKRYVPKEQQYRYTKRILAAKTNKRIENMTFAINQYLNRAEQRQTIRDFRNFVGATKKKYRAGKTQLGKLRNDVRTKLIDVLEKYDVTKLSEEKREKLESRSEYIRNVAGSVADAYESLEETGKDVLQMPNAQIEELNRLRKTHIGELDSDEIRYIQASLEHLLKIAERKGEIKERIRAENIRKLVNQARQEVHQKAKERGVVKETLGTFSFAKRLFTTAQATPRTLIGFMTKKDNPASVKLITDNLRNMTKEKHRIAKDFITSFEKMLTDAGVTKKDTDKLLDKTTITFGGKTFKIDISNLLGVYMDTQAEGNLQSMLKSGRVFKIYERDPNKMYIKIKKVIHTRRPSLSELRGIVDYVENKNPVLKKMADVFFKHNHTVQSPVVNKTSMEYQNYELARKRKYWHQSRFMPLGVEGKKTDISVSVENQGRYLPRTGGKRPLINQPYLQEVIATIQANAAFASMTIPMQNVKALVGDETWQNEVIKSGQRKELQTLIKMIRRIQGMVTDKDFIDLAGAGILSNFGKYALSLRLSGYGVQTASIPAAFEVIEPKYFLKAQSVARLPQIPIRAIKEIMELSPTLWMRWTARQFDFVLGGAAAQNSFDTLIWGKKSATEKLLNHYTWGDQKAIYQIYIAAQNKVSAETDLRKGTKEFKKKAIEITEKALETQPTWDMIHRNELLSNPNIILRGSLMFHSARNAQYNVILRAIDDYKKGRIGPGEFGKRTSGVVYANILVALVKRIVKLGMKFGWLGLLFFTGKRRKRKKVEKVAVAEIKKLPAQLAIDAALNLISLPAFGGIAQNIAYETMRRFKYPQMKHKLKDVRTGNIFADLSLDVTGVISDAGVMTKHIITGEKFKSGPDKGELKWKRTAKELADGLAELIAIRYGLPYSAPKGEIYYQVKSAQRAVEKAK